MIRTDGAKLYDVIYADPPWRYRHCASNNRKVENQYPTMALSEIKAFPVPAARDSVLYLWVPSPKLGEGLEVMSAWGFDYRSSLVWDKERIGMGYWFRGQHELLVVGVKGVVSPPPQALRVSSVFREPRTAHSRKPDRIREMIARWFPDAAKIELFARRRYPGWEAWGNELACSHSAAVRDESTTAAFCPACGSSYHLATGWSSQR